MKFEITPQLIITKDELKTLDNALKLCRDMDAATALNNEDFEAGKLSGCNICPLWSTCNKRTQTCVFIVAHKALKEIIDTAVVK